MSVRNVMLQQQERQAEDDLRIMRMRAELNQLTTQLVAERRVNATLRHENATLRKQNELLSAHVDDLAVLISGKKVR